MRKNANLANTWCLGRVSLFFIVVTALPALAQAPIFSLGPVSALNHANKITLNVSLRNGGSSPATSVTITSVTLGLEGASIQKLPTNVGTLLPNGETSLTLSFSSLAKVQGTKQLLTIRGTYVSGGGTLGFAVNRFVAIPQPLGSSDNYGIYGNDTDPGILHAELAEGQVVDYYGTKDSSGHATAVEFARVISDAGVTQYTFDGQFLPQKVRFPNGMTWDFEWKSTTETLVTATTGDGTARFASTINFATGRTSPTSNAELTRTALNSPPRTNEARLEKSRPSSALSVSDPAGNAAIIARTCSQPEDNATVQVDVGWLLAGRNGIPATDYGQGVYLAPIPSPSQSSEQDTTGKAAAAAEAVNKVCEAYDNLQKSLDLVFGPGAGVKVEAVVCSALTGAAALYAPPAVPYVAAACPLFFVGLEVVCHANEAIKFVNKVIDTVDAEGPVTIHPVATLDATSLTPDGAYFSFPVTGPFGPIPIIDFGCPGLDIGIQPASLSLDVGHQGTLAKTHVSWDYNGSAYTSSTLRLQWISNNPAIASVDQNGVVTGVKTGTTTIYLKDASTGSKSGLVTVTVADTIPIVGTWVGTATWSNNYGDTSRLQVTAIVSHSGNKLTATVVFTDDSGLSEMHTETGTLNGSAFSLPVDSQGRHVNVVGRFSGLTMTGSGTSPEDGSSGSGSVFVSKDKTTLTGSATGTDNAVQSMRWTLKKQ
jgi:Bacterial Ig-like domain (group 2)